MDPLTNFAKAYIDGQIAALEAEMKDYGMTIRECKQEQDRCSIKIDILRRKRAAIESGTVNIEVRL